MTLEAGHIQEEDLNFKDEKNVHNIFDSLTSDPGSSSIEPLNTTSNPESLWIGYAQ